MMDSNEVDTEIISNESEQLENESGSVTINQENLNSHTSPNIGSLNVENEVSSLEVTNIENVNNNNEGENNENQASLDAEMVSEDELPMPIKPEINDAEEVSDEELPAPKRAELPPDAEVVSEDEFSTPKRSDVPPDVDSVSEDELPKIQESEKPVTENLVNAEKVIHKRKNGSEEEELKGGKKPKSDDVECENSEVKKIKLPELEKFWKAVKDDETDFTAWTYLLQYVDQETDVEAAREAYDKFLARYPYCYGYWRKYADFEKRKGEKSKALEVCQRGLKAIPLSVDLWIYYISFMKTMYNEKDDLIRKEYDNAIKTCGLEFRSDKLWDSYVKWETDGKRYNKVLNIYDKLLSIPTQGYSTHYNNFQDLVHNHSPSSIINIEEFQKIRTEIISNNIKLPAKKKDRKEKEKRRDKDDKDSLRRKSTDEKSDIEDLCEKESNDKSPDNEIKEEEALDPYFVKNDEELAQIKEKIISQRRKIYKQTISSVTARWTYEERIKRPYFHVKPLEKCQLNNWRDYIEYEIEKGDKERILVLFERCLIACALYEEFWIKLINYLESLNDSTKVSSKIRRAYERACTIHHKNKPNIHLRWAAFEEHNGNIDKSAEILANIDNVCPNLLQIAYRRINVERRRGHYDKCKDLYLQYINEAKDKKITGCLSIKYSRFVHKILKDYDLALSFLNDTLKSDPNNTRVALHLIDICLQRDNVEEKEIVEIMDGFINRETVEVDQKILFAQRKVEFLEDFGSTAKGLQDAQKTLQNLLQKAKENQKKGSDTEKKSKDTSISSVGNSTANVAYTGYNYGNYYNQGGQQTYSQPYDSFGYNHWHQATGASYGSYGQWNGNYGSYY